MGGAVVTLVTALGAWPSFYDWWQRPRAELRVEATATEDVILEPSLEAMQQWTPLRYPDAYIRDLRERGKAVPPPDTSRPKPTLTRTAGRWHLVARNTGGRRLREVTLAIPGAEYVCIRREQQAVHCGSATASRDLGTLDPGEAVTADAWGSTFGGFYPLLASPDEAPRVTHSEGVGTVDVLVPYSRTTINRYLSATRWAVLIGGLVVSILALSVVIWAVDRWRFARVRGAEARS